MLNWLNLIQTEIRCRIEELSIESNEESRLDANSVI